MFDFYGQALLIARVRNIIAGISFSQTSVIYFCQGSSCCPYYRGVHNSKVSTRPLLSVLVLTTCWCGQQCSDKNLLMYNELLEVNCILQVKSLNKSSLSGHLRKIKGS